MLLVAARAVELISPSTDWLNRDAPVGLRCLRLCASAAVRATADAQLMRDFTWSSSSRDGRCPRGTREPNPLLQRRDTLSPPQPGLPLPLKPGAIAITSGHCLPWRAGTHAPSIGPLSVRSTLEPDALREEIRCGGSASFDPRTRLRGRDRVGLGTDPPVVA